MGFRRQSILADKSQQLHRATVGGMMVESEREAILLKGVDMKQHTGIKRGNIVVVPKSDAVVSSIDAGKTLCELSGWVVSNLQLQKILYLAHMLHLGRIGKPLTNDGFQAWEYGPVAPSLHHRVKGFGSKPIQKIIFWEKGTEGGSTQFGLLHETMTAMKGLTGAQLVSLTHWEKGAWYQTYRGGKRGIPIPDNLIIKEYNARQNELDAQR